MAYGWEARARAMASCGRIEEARIAKAQARDLAAEVEDAESRAMLELDLDTILV
jgi:hypothetical protein